MFASTSFRAAPSSARLQRAAISRATTVRATCKASSAMEPITIVGGGRIGLALADMGSGSDVLVKRGEAVPSNAPPGPIVVCTRNNDLQSVVDGTPKDRRKDLVFIQNGMLQPWLDAQSLGDNTQVLVYFAVAKKGEKPTDGKTDVNPEGLTAAHGKHAAAVAARLISGGLSCKVLEKEPFQRAMLEKLVWISAFMLVGQKHGVTVGEVEKAHKAEVSKLIVEMAAAGEKELGIKLDAGSLERLLAYARSVAHFPTAVKEYQWRNGWFYDISKRELAAGRPDPMPFHTQLLKEVKAI